jgi:hypothetical protein
VLHDRLLRAKLPPAGRAAPLLRLLRLPRLRLPLLRVPAEASIQSELRTARLAPRARGAHHLHTPHRSAPGVDQCAKLLPVASRPALVVGERDLTELLPAA